MQSSFPAKSTHQVYHFSLPGILADKQIFALSEELHILSCLSSTGEHPCLIAQEQFSHNEFIVLKLLLENYPHYCPIEVIWQGLFQCDIEGKYGIKPVRDTISRMRFKCKKFGFTIRSLQFTGYTLVPIRPPKVSNETPCDVNRSST